MLFSRSGMSSSATPWTAARQAFLSIANSRSLLKLMSIESVMPSNHLILCHPLLLLSVSPSIRVFSNESVLHIRWPNIGTSASTSVLLMSIQGWFSLGLTHLISLLSKGLSRVFSNITIWKQQFFGAQPSLWAYSHICTWLLEKTELWLDRSLSAKWCLCFLICYLGLPLLSFQGASVFSFLGCSHRPHATLFGSSQLVTGQSPLNAWKEEVSQNLPRVLCLCWGTSAQADSLQVCLSLYFLLHRVSRWARGESLGPSQVFPENVHSSTHMSGLLDS